MSSVSRMMITSQMMWNYIVLHIFNVIASADYLNVDHNIKWIILPNIFYTLTPARRVGDYRADNILYYLHPDLNRNARGQLILNQSWLPISPCRQSMFLASTQAYFYSMVQWSSVVVWGNLFLVLSFYD